MCWWPAASTISEALHGLTDLTQGLANFDEVPARAEAEGGDLIRLQDPRIRGFSRCSRRLRIPHFVPSPTGRVEVAEYAFRGSVGSAGLESVPGVRARR